MVAVRRCLVLLVLASSCAKSTVGGRDIGNMPAESQPTAARRVARNPNVIVREEFQDPRIVGMDALNAIRQLRPAFFRLAGPQSAVNAGAGTVQVSLDYGPLVPVAQLAAFDTPNLYEVRYLEPTAAQARFGLNANSGPVIVLVMSRHSQ